MRMENLRRAQSIKSDSSKESHKINSEKWGKINFLLGFLLLLGGLLRMARYFISVYYYQDELERQIYLKRKTMKASDGTFHVEADKEDVTMIHTLDWSIILLFFLQGFITLRGAATVLKAHQNL